MSTPAVLPTCVACRAPVDEKSALCAHCGSPLSSSVRRLVAVVFADLAGYSSWSATRDPEDVHDLIRPLMNALRRACQSYDGTVSSIEGDGLMAVFGAHRADEDAVSRALLCAVRLQEVTTERLRGLQADLPGLKVGVHAGEVLVAPSWESAGFSVAGEAVNLARRICEAALPGTVLSHQVVSELVPAEAGWGPVAWIEPKGYSAQVPVRQFDWTGPAEGLTRGRELSTTPLVGREEVLARLDALGSAAPVLLLGEPGVGKTRLAEVWARGRGGRVLLVRCPSFSVDGPLAPLSDLAACLLDGAQPTHQRALRRLTGDALDTEELDPEAAVVSALVAELAAAAERDPLVLLVDDLHDASRPVRQLVEGLLEQGAPVQVLATSRRPVGWGGWHEVDVAPLDETASSELVGHLLPGADSHVLELMRSRCGGVPLFVEQCARLLLEQGLVVADGGRLGLVQGAGQRAKVRGVPTSLRLFVAARLEALSAQERLVLDVASVLGDEIDVDLLRHLADVELEAPLEALVARSLLRWHTRASGAESLGFAHALVRDVAYESQLRAQRVARHLAAAEWYAVLPIAEVLEAQARHLEAAVGLGQPDCDLVRRAVEAMGLHARAISEERPADALDVLDRALALGQSRPECDIDLLTLHLVRLGALTSAGRETEAAAVGVEVTERARERQEPLQLAEALFQHGRALVLADAPRALPLLAEAEELFLALDDAASVAEVGVHRARAAEQVEGLPLQITAHQHAFEAAIRAGDVRLQSQSAQQLAMYAFALGRPDLERWVRAARDLQRPDDLVGPARLSAAEAGVAMYARDDAEAVELGVQAQQLGARAGLTSAVINGILSEIEGLLALGRLEEAAARIRVAEELAASRPTTLMTFNVMLESLCLRRRQGRVAQATVLREALTGDVRERGRLADANFQERLALDCLERGLFAQAAQHARAALTTNDEVGHAFPVLRIAVTLSAACVSGGLPLPLRDSTRGRREARERGAPAIEALLSHWWDLDEALSGHPAMPMPVPDCDLAEVRAVRCEAAGLRGDSDALLEAAAHWGALGATVFRARPLLWHEELTGTPHPEADELLALLDAPAGLAEDFRAQVRHLRR